MQSRRRQLLDRAADRPRIDEHAIVEGLAERFASFRGRSRRFARVPRDLRAAVVAALRQGVSPGRVRRACGISTSQLELWRRAPDAGASAGGEHRDARVFAVVDSAPPRPSPRHPPSTASGALELRIGPWAVSVRLVGQQPVGRQ